MIYRHKDPTDIEIKEIKVPIHLPNIIPDNMSIGEPNPNNITQNAEKIKKTIKLKYKFFPTIFSKPV